MSWHAVGTYRIFDGRGGGRQVRNPLHPLSLNRAQV
jgi:catalase-peroxidase